MSIRPSAYEFFAGGGLAGLGLSDAGIDTVFATDMDAAKARAFMTNHPQTPFRQGDVWGLTLDDLPGRPDMAWASSPCQDVSLAGARGGLEAGRSGAFWGFWRLMQGLAAALPEVAVTSTSQFGIDPQAVEAAAFAWLASKTLRREPVDWRSVTGTGAAHVPGCLYAAAY